MLGCSKTISAEGDGVLISIKKNVMCGDISRGIYDLFRVITPVPSGIGVMTVLNVVKNIIKCYKNK